MDQLIIDDTNADLSSDSPIAITFQVNDLSNFKDRQSIYTNAIKLPLTANNLKIWGYPTADAFTQDQPYKKLSCKIIRNGVELIARGVISLLSVSNSLECQATYGVTGFADALKVYVSTGGIITEIRDATLSDLDWSDIAPFQYNLTTVVNSHTQYNPLWAIIDYGSTLNNSLSANINFLRPGILYSQIFDRIERLTGYTFFGGKAFTDGMDDYIPLSNGLTLNNQFGNPYTSGDLITVAANLPDITIKDLITDFMNRYFLTPVVDNLKKTFTFKSFDDLYNNKEYAKDWSDNFVDDIPTINFTFGEYAQNNTLTWDNDGFFLQPPGGYIVTIANETLKTDTTIYTSVFSSSENALKIGGQQVAVIKKLKTPPNVVEPFDIETKTRVLRVYKNYSGISITDGTNNTIVPIYNVAKQNTWKEQLDLYGDGFLRLLKKARAVDVKAKLLETDVQNFDHFTPVYNQREGKYYYVNKIANFISGKITSVSLIRM